MALVSIDNVVAGTTHVGRSICRIAYAMMLFFTFFDFVTSSTAQALDYGPLCYSEKGGSIRNVNSCASLATALSNANPGDIIVLADGSYNCPNTLARSGSSTRPIIIRAANPRLAKIVDASFTIGGSHIVLANLTFDNSGVNVTGNYNRITGNKFQNNAGSLRAAVTVDRGNSNRIDHNEVVDYGTGQRGFRIIPASSGNNTAKNNVIDRNYLHRSLGAKANGADGIQLGSNTDHTYEQLYSIVEYNLIEQWEIDGEMISNKSSNNIIRFNTLADSKAIGPMRHGSHVEIISNYFVNVVALINHGDDNKIIGNVVENGDLVIKNGDIYQSDLPTNPGGHPASARALVAANTIINGEICVGCRTPGGDASSGAPATFTDLRGNKGKLTLLDQRNTTQSTTYNGVVTPAVRLFTHNVGPGSPDVCTANTGNTPLSPSSLNVIKTF